MNKVDREKLVSEKLQTIGVPCHISGFAMLKEAILVVIDDIKKLKGLTKDLYPSIAVKFNSTGSRVERAMRHALELTWERKSVLELKVLIGPMVTEERMFLGQFIATIAEQLRIEIKQKAS